MFPWWWLSALLLLGLNLGMTLDDLIHNAKLKASGACPERGMAWIAFTIFMYGLILVSMILWGAGVKIPPIRNGIATCILTFLLLTLLASREYIERKKRPKK